MWKILTTQIREEIYYTLIIQALFTEEQKRRWKETKRTRDQPILKEKRGVSSRCNV